MNRLACMSAWSLAFALSVGCGNGDGRPSDSLDGVPGGKEDSLFPTGTDKLGYINIVQADGSSLGLTPVGGTSVLVDGKAPIMPTGPLRVVEGARTVALSNDKISYSTGYSVAQVLVEKGKTTDLFLAGLHPLAFAEYPTTLGNTLQWNVPGGDLVHGALLKDAAAKDVFLPIVPKDLTIQLMGDQVVHSVAVAPKPGEIATPDLSLADPRVTFVVAKPDRTLPSFVDQPIVLFASPKSLKDLFPYSSTSHPWAYNQLLSGTYRIAKEGDAFTAIANEHTAQHYYLAVGMAVVEISGSAGTTVDAPLRRLDVNDVEVELETGATKAYKGTWSLARQTPSSTDYDPLPSLTNIPTGKGLDVVPGKYRVTVSYPRDEQPSPDVKRYDIEIK